MFCTNCGQKNADNAAFCVYCGARLGESGADSTQPGAYAPQPDAYAQQPGAPAMQPPKKKPSAARWAVPLAIVLTLAIAAAVVFSLRKTCAICEKTFFGKSHSLYGYDICDDCWTNDGYGDIFDYYDDVLNLFD